MYGEDDPVVSKLQAVIAMASAMLVPAVAVFRLVAPLFRKKPKQK